MTSESNFQRALRKVGKPRVAGSNTDPVRPIVAREPLLYEVDCKHPWARVALVPSGRYLTLQCFDCGCFLRINGELIGPFELH